MVSPEIEDYARRHSAPEQPVLKALSRHTWERVSWPQMLVGHLEGQFLTLLTRAVRARRVLEIGTFTGYSALAFAAGLPPGGEVVTLDIDPVNTAVARRFWERSPLGRKITLRVGDAKESLKTLKGPFDVVFIDADKSGYQRYWDACVPLVRPGGLLLVDNVLWSGRVLAPKDAETRTIARFNRSVARDRRVDLVMLPFRDGITMAVKRG